jgi:hypothetical protein
MKTARFVSVLAIAVCISLLLTAANTLNPSPIARGYSQMTYDSNSGKVVLYGGQIGAWQAPNSLSYDTWLFDPITKVWVEKSPPTSPGGSGGGDMTFNSKADRSILSVYADDFSAMQTWAYNANADEWTRLQDWPGDIMVGQRIVYDSESDRIIMFGGFTLTDYSFVDETWVYDYNTDTWTNMQTKVHPTGRNYVGMVYDSKVDRVVVWGDWNKNYNPSLDSSVWTYDYNTNTWQEIKQKKNGPAVRDYQSLAYDAKADKIIMYGGYDYGNDETWVYDLGTNTWQKMQTAQNPGALSRYSMVYAKSANKTVLFGGQVGPAYYNYMGETWLYNLKRNTWTNALLGD